VRIAISAAIGLSVATGAELLGIPSVAALGEGEYVALGDARRGGYYAILVGDGEMAAAPMLMTREELEAGIAGLNTPAYSSEDLKLSGVELRFPRVEVIGRLAVANRGIHARGVLEPIYLREPHITMPKPIS
jgi:tRNA A37 threonylcarbamoyladenosine modification protein TsaB